MVPPGQEAAFLAPLPADPLWGVGPKTAARLAELGIHTIGELARWPEDDLVRRFGKNGLDMRAMPGASTTARSSPPRAQVGQPGDHLHPRRERRELLRTDAAEQAADVSRDSRRSQRCVGTTVKLKLRWSDFTTITRQVTIDQATADAGVVRPVRWRCLTANGPDSRCD